MRSGKGSHRQNRHRALLIDVYEAVGGSPVFTGTQDRTSELLARAILETAHLYEGELRTFRPVANKRAVLPATRELRDEARGRVNDAEIALTALAAIARAESTTLNTVYGTCGDTSDGDTSRVTLTTTLQDVWLSVQASDGRVSSLGMSSEIHDLRDPRAEVISHTLPAMAAVAVAAVSFLPQYSSGLSQSSNSLPA